MSKNPRQNTPSRRGRAPASRPAPARSGASRQDQPRPVPGWVWVLGLTILGAFGGFLYYLTQVPTEQPAQTQQPAKQAPAAVEPKPKQPPADTAKTAKNVKEEPARFEFYDMLPKTEVVPPKVEEYQPSDKKQEQYHYLVQVGSFRRMEEAERQRAMIAFQGLKGQIDQVTSDDGSRWYRVHIGPFSSRSQMNRAVDKLVAMDIQPLVKRIKPENATSSK